MNASTATEGRDRTAMPTMIYVAGGRSNEIAAFLFDIEDGELEDVQHVPAAGSVTPLAVRPDATVLYAGVRGDRPSVTSYAIDRSTGQLRFQASVDLADPQISLATDTTGNVLLSASYTGASMTTQRIRADGPLMPRRPAPERRRRTRTASLAIAVTALSSSRRSVETSFYNSTSTKRPDA